MYDNLEFELFVESAPQKTSLRFKSTDRLNKRGVVEVNGRGSDTVHPLWQPKEWFQVLLGCTNELRTACLVFVEGPRAPLALVGINW